MYASLCNLTITRYSGRSMYGQYCLGLDGDSDNDFAKFLVEVANKNVAVARDLANDLTTDNMGLGYIYYFPNIAFTGFTDENDDELGECDDCGDEYVLGSDDHDPETGICNDCTNRKAINV